MSSVILNVIISHLIPFLEEEFVKHEPEIQEALVKEVKVLAAKLEEWSKAKIQQKGH